MRAGNAHANRAARIGVAGFEDGKERRVSGKGKAKAAVGSSSIPNLARRKGEHPRLRREKVAELEHLERQERLQRVNLGQNPPAAVPKTRGRGNVIA